VLAVDLGAPLPLLPGSADADRIADRPTLVENIIELALVGAYDDRARLLGAVVRHELACEFRVALGEFVRRDLRLVRERCERIRHQGVGELGLNSPTAARQTDNCEEETASRKHDKPRGVRFGTHEWPV